MGAIFNEPCMTYAEKLRDPRWQRKRLEILQRDDFTCRYCGSKDETLHVHHLQYQWGKDPWDYHSGHLLTLCATCHETESAMRKESEHKLLEFLRLIALAKADDVDDLVNTLFLRTLDTGHPYGVVVSAIEFALRDGSFIQKYLDHKEEVRKKYSGGGEM